MGGPFAGATNGPKAWLAACEPAILAISADIDKYVQAPFRRGISIHMIKKKTPKGPSSRKEHQNQRQIGHQCIHRGYTYSNVDQAAITDRGNWRHGSRLRAASPTDTMR
jgi:hypothetical protein